MTELYLHETIGLCFARQKKIEGLWHLQSIIHAPPPTPTPPTRARTHTNTVTEHQQKHIAVRTPVGWLVVQQAVLQSHLDGTAVAYSISCIAPHQLSHIVSLPTFFVLALPAGIY